MNTKVIHYIKKKTADYEPGHYTKILIDSQSIPT